MSFGRTDEPLFSNASPLTAALEVFDGDAVGGEEIRPDVRMIEPSAFDKMSVLCTPGLLARRESRAVVSTGDWGRDQYVKIPNLNGVEEPYYRFSHISQPMRKLQLSSNSMQERHLALVVTLEIPE